MRRLTDFLQWPVRVLVIVALVVLIAGVLKVNGLIPEISTKSTRSGFQMSPEERAYLLEREAIERMSREFESDPRIPTVTDLSGVWSSATLGVGYSLQLDHRAHGVFGRGFHWGCMGSYDLFDVAGSYDGNELVLLFNEEPPRSGKFILDRTDGLLRFRGVEHSSDRPVRDLVTRDDKRIWLNRYFSKPQEIETNDGDGEGAGIGDASKIQ